MSINLKNRLPFVDRLFVPIFILSLVAFSFQYSKADATEHENVKSTIELNRIIDEHVKDRFNFYGLASFYNKVDVFITSTKKVQNINDLEEVTLADAEWLCIAGRFNVLLIKVPGARLVQTKDFKRIIFPDGYEVTGSETVIVSKTNLGSIDAALDKLKYQHLWKPLELITRFMEFLLSQLESFHRGGIIVSVMIASIIINLVLIPLNIWEAKIQCKVDRIASIVSERRKVIINEFQDNQIIHEKIMNVHKKLSVTPFYQLRTSIFLLIKIPIIIGIFNALGEMPQTLGQSFLWAGDVAYPDVIFNLGFAIPVMGETLNAMSILMLIVMLYCTKPDGASKSNPAASGGIKNKSVIFALLVFVLFYPFPFVIVFYWTFNFLVQYSITRNLLNATSNTKAQ